jgi:hypothetical protein
VPSVINACDKVLQGRAAPRRYLFQRLEKLRLKADAGQVARNGDRSLPHQGFGLLRFHWLAPEGGIVARPRTASCVIGVPERCALRHRTPTTLRPPSPNHFVRAWLDASNWACRWKCPPPQSSTIGDVGAGPSCKFPVPGIWKPWSSPGRCALRHWSLPGVGGVCINLARALSAPQSNGTGGPFGNLPPGTVLAHLRHAVAARSQITHLGNLETEAGPSVASAR